MRFFLKTLVAIAIAAFIAGLLTYPVWLLVSQFSDYRPDRVMRRIGSILLIVGLWWILRREGMANRETFGYGIARRDFARQLLVGLGAGLALMLPLVFALVSLSVRTWNVNTTVAAISASFGQGLLIGFLVAFLEETVVRGAMFSIIRQESGAITAVVLTSALFASVHFFQAELRIPANQMNFASGLRFAGDIFAKFSDPIAIADALAALFALGVLLSLIRLRTGAIAGSIGVHAGGIAIIWVVGDCTAMNADISPRWLVPSYNNVVGWVAFVWISAVALLYWKTGKKWTRERQAGFLSSH